MSLRKIVLGGLASAGSVLVLSVTPGIAAAASAPPANPTNVEVGANATANPNFYLTFGTPTSNVITANFNETVANTTAAADYFNYSFNFTIPQNGMGSGSLSTSFSSALNELDITAVSINGTPEAITATGSGQTVTANNIAIANLVPNSIDVQGFVLAGSQVGTFDGTATFVASAAPEPAEWLLTIAGIGMMGLMLRRRQGALGVV